MRKVEEFFKDITYNKELQSQLNEVYRKTLTLNFNPLDFVKWDENKVSEIIAFLLNPRASHEQGDLYLKLFVNYFDLSFTYSDSSKVDVILEANTDEKRRVDIIISYDNYKRVIGIENKIYPWTKDQKLQVADYLIHLKKYCSTEDYHLIYLAPKEKVLDKGSAGENYEELLVDGKLKLINYEEHMIELIYQFSQHTYNDRIRSFIKDFELKLRNNYLGNDMIDNNKVVNFIEADKDNLSIAFAVSNNLNIVKQNLKDEFKRQMEELAEELNLKYESEHGHFILTNFRKLYAKFSFESGGLIYGLVKTPEYLKINPDKIYLSEVAEHIKTQFSHSKWWPLWNYKYKSIDVNDEFWLAVKDGSLKEFSKNFLESLKNLPEEITKDY